MRKQKSSRAKDRKSGRRPARMTHGRDNMASNSNHKDYYVSEALDITPHPNQGLVAVLGRPIMDRRLKYSLSEQSLVGSNQTSATPLSLVSISQGTTDITRTGDRIRAKRLWMSGKLYGSASASAPYAARLLIVLWNPVGTGAINSPVAGQVIQHNSNYGPFGSYSRDFGDSYQVVYDALYSLEPLSTTSEYTLFHIDRKLTVDMEFIAGATTPCTNNLYVFLLTENAATTPTVTFSSTLWYEDLDA